MSRVAALRRGGGRAVLALASLIPWSANAYAQRITGELSGTVADTSEGLVSGADVVLANEDSGTTRRSLDERRVRAAAGGRQVWPADRPARPSFRRHVTPAAWRVVAGCIGLSALPAPSPGQAAPPPILEITTVTRVVDVYVTVKDAQGRLVTSLGRDRFDLREDGVRQQVDYFAHETDAPLSLGLVIDTSASQAQLLPTEREKAAAFLHAVLGASDRAFVMRFDQEVVLLQGLTAEIALLARAIDAVHADAGSAPSSADPSEGRRPRGTRLYDAIRQASELLSGQKGRKVLVLLTDGEDQGSRVTRGAALEAAERAEVIVYSVLVADPLFYWARGRDFKGEAALAALQAKTGGWMVRPESAQGLDEIASELRAQYRLGYTPRTARYDGSFRRIEVRLQGVRHTVRARRGYYASAE